MTRGVSGLRYLWYLFFLFAVWILSFSIGTSVGDVGLVELDELNLSPVKHLIEAYGSKVEKEEFQMFQDKVMRSFSRRPQRWRNQGEGRV